LSLANLGQHFLPFWEASATPMLEDRLIILMAALIANSMLLPWRVWVEIPKALIPGYWVEQYLSGAERKLNRSNRSPNAKLVRGALVILPPLLIGLYVGDVLSNIAGWFKHSWVVASAILLCLLHGRMYHDVAWHILYRNHDMSLHESRQKLNSISPYDHEVLDIHGVFRQTLETLGGVFSERMTGVGFWFLLGGLPMAITYYLLHRMYRLIAIPSDHMAQFGWAAASLYNLLAAWPAWLGSLMLSFSAFFVPGTRAFPSIGAFFTGLWKFPPSQLSVYVYAEALDLQLGGKKRLKGGQTTHHQWVGDGQPKVTESQLRYGIGMFQLAWLLFIGILGLCYLYVA